MKPVHADRPVVHLNAAISADGKLAPASRRFAPFAGKADERWLHELRSQCDAIVCGAATLRLGGFTMGSGGEAFRARRLERGLARDAIRVVVSGSASLEPDAAVFQTDFSPVLLLATSAAPLEKLKRLRSRTAGIHVSPGSQVDIHSALSWLAREWGLKSLVCEGGGQVYGAFLAADAVDHLHLSIAPLIFGGSQAPTIGDGAGILSLKDAARYRFVGSMRTPKAFFAHFDRAKVVSPPA